ncbi:hypothetical protein QBC32DRAFT_328263 [Pseudoneurospora amorphoporcata]|uniref:Uncharacterized protein n=1 Tax=Pseudoneurospora amorphoporcata TaxID=241081 RepID=A0AAN6SBS7_9PEZI|nr:hypothetical protein QBC32DRAFT_328263 [Pseudoneurospora amorphoporcata]
MKASGPPVRKVIPMPCSNANEFPTSLVIVLFLSFFVTFFGLTLLATSTHMHHPYKLGVLYVVDSVPAKGWIRQRPSDSPSPVAPCCLSNWYLVVVTARWRNSLASYMKRLEEEEKEKEEQKKINDIIVAREEPEHGGR